MTKNNPTAALIIIGNEILSGRTQDKNINYIAKKLGEVGINFVEVRVIPDIEATIVATVNELRNKFTYVFTTGGIGPTHDDITAQSIAKAFGVELEVHAETLAQMNEYYKGDVNEGRIKMATLPMGAWPIENAISVAPGFCIENVYVMAGIPNVMQAMFDSIKGGLKSGAVILSKEIKIFKPESVIAPILTKAQNDNPEVEIGSYPFIHDNKVGVSIVIRSSDEDALNSTYSALEKSL